MSTHARLVLHVLDGQRKLPDPGDRQSCCLVPTLGVLPVPSPAIRPTEPADSLKPLGSASVLTYDIGLKMPHPLDGKGKVFSDNRHGMPEPRPSNSNFNREFELGGLCVTRGWAEFAKIPIQAGRDASGRDNLPATSLICPDPVELPLCWLIRSVGPRALTAQGDECLEESRTQSERSENSTQPVESQSTETPQKTRSLTVRTTLST